MDGTVEELIVKLKGLPAFVGKVANGALAVQGEGLADVNREQLLAGLGIDGAFLPKYIDDPFFKSDLTALRYQAWKKKVSPNTSKPEEVMDFYINGSFHDTIDFHKTAEGGELDSDSPILSSVEGKTNDRVIGLTPSNEDLLTEEIGAAIEKETDKYL